MSIAGTLGRAVLAAASAVVLFEAVLFFRIGTWVMFDPPTTSFMHAREIALDAKTPGAQLKHVWVPYDRIARPVKRAVIAAEDSNFAEHRGIDIEALERAYEKNRRRGRVVAGGSTITQQLAKNLFLSGERSYVRKAQEFIVTFMLEFWCTKQRIFEIYLNVVEWGEGVFGIEAAAQHYYRVSADRLNAMQAAKLAAMLPNPRFFDRNRFHPQLLRRAATVLARMNAAQLP
ncbi:MAG TPA: monofunctional biosynthetic peptidoglycan transglycosylase [Burkholderiaceae bacterium]|nr:monofunctional biosynthetic peptidoglycan transglycosylase [Burkholderiaceae bacterium]